MNKVEPRTLKGFRDFLPLEARKRQYVQNILREVFESFGFDPLETPTLEYEDILLGKYGAEGDKLMYRFTDNGERKVALRYDQTVPLARVAAQYTELPKPFKRYQIQNVFRAENTQKGRFREFLQCDFDTVGLSSTYADAEIIAVVVKSFEKLGFNNFKVQVNDRDTFTNLAKKGVVKEQDLMAVIRSIDKIKKIGRDEVLKEIKELGYSESESETIIKTVENEPQTANLQAILTSVKDLGVLDNKVEYSPTLARGLDYYTGLILEVECEDYTVGSLGGGGRYDNLLGIFTKESLPAVGFAFGFDRVMESMGELKLFPEDLATTKVLVTIFSSETGEVSVGIANELRDNKINTELWLDADSKLEKQLKYANAKKIPYVVIIGPDEVKNGNVVLKDLRNRTQEILSVRDLISKLS